MFEDEKNTKFHLLHFFKKIQIKYFFFNKFKEIINKNNLNDKNIIYSIEKILNQEIYKYNYDFLHLIKKTLGKDSTNSKLFNEFFGEEFKDYYKYMIKEIQQDNYYYLNILSNMSDYYNDKEINNQYFMFALSNNIRCSKNINKITNKNNQKFSLISRYFHTILDMKVQKQVFDSETKIKEELIKNEENNILIKCILNSESLYQYELLKLIDRSIAENIIVYLIEKYPDNFKKIDLNLIIYADLEKYYKYEPDKFNKIKTEYRAQISSFLDNKQDNKTSNKIIFAESIKVGKININVNELNQMLEFLFYIKEQGNFTAHPKNEKTYPISPNSHAYKFSNKNEDLNKIKNKVEKLLKNEFLKNNFNIVIKPKSAFDCLFKANFKSLFNSKENVQINNKIDATLNEVLNEMKGIEKNENIFEIYTEKMKELEKIYEDINENKTIKEKNLNIHPSLNEFFQRLDKLLDNEIKVLSILYRLSENEYETSVTGDKILFFSLCLDYIIKKIFSKINAKIKEYQKVKVLAKNLIQSKDEIIFLLSNLNKKMGNLDEFTERDHINDPDRITEYMNKVMNESKIEKIDLNDIRSNIEKVVTESINWTASKNCKLSTLLFLAQNNK